MSRHSLTIVVTLCVSGVWTLDAAPLALIPKPREVAEHSAPFVLDASAATVLGKANDQLDRFAVGTLQDDLRNLWKAELPIATAPTKRPLLVGIPSRDASVRAACERRGLQVTPDLGDEGYVLDVNADGGVAAANTAAGVFYAVQTLRQLVRRLPDGRVAIEGVRIRDWPGLRYRGVQDDVSRGPVPTMDYFRKQIRTLAAFKINVFCLYIEHVFKFQKHPQIAPEGAEITAEQIRELIDYGGKYHVELLPQIQSFAHQAHILKHPEFAELREMPEGGHVFCPLNDGTYKLLADLYSEFVPIHDMKFFHVGCDETFELGQGRSKAKAAEIGVDGLYLQHMKRLREILLPYGKRLMFWGDIALHHKDMIPKLPKDYVVMNWTYGAATNYLARLEPFKTAGLDQWVCPGVSCWNQIFPNCGVARTNIAYFVRDGAAMGAQGMLNTAWDDDGENLTEYNWYGFVWSADCAWRPEKFDTARFNAAFARTFHRADAPELTEAINLMSSLHDVLRAQRSSDATFWEDPFGGKRSVQGGKANERLRQIVNVSAKALTLAEQGRPKARQNTASVDAMAFAARRWSFLARKFITADEVAAAYRRAADEPQNRALVTNSLHTSAVKLLELAAELRCLREEYRRLWLVENRPHYLQQITSRYDALADRLSAKAKQIENALAGYLKTGLLPEPEQLQLGDPQQLRRARSPQSFQPPKDSTARAQWWNNAWTYRVLVKLDAGSLERTDYPVELALDFTKLLREAGESGTFNPLSVRVVEAGRELPSQFDRAAKFDALHHAAGNVAWIANGRTAAKTTRHFGIYFDTRAKAAPGYAGVTTGDGPNGGKWVETSRIKVLLGTEGGHAFIWQVKALNNLDLTQPGERDWAGFLDTRGYRKEKFTLQCEASGPVLVRYRMTATDGFAKVVSFYGDQPWCETFLSLATTDFWDFDNADLMSATSRTPGNYIFSNGATGEVLKPGELSVAQEGTWWGAKFRPDGLTLGNVTPDDRAQHRVGPGGGMGGVGTEGRAAAMHFVTFGGILDDKAGVAKTMEDLRRTMTLANPPAVFIADVEHSP